MCFSPSPPPHRYAPEERKREMKAGNSSSFNINTIWSKETKSYLCYLYFEKVEDAWWLLEGVRLAKLIQLCQSSLQVTVGTKTNAHCNSLIDTKYRNHKKAIKMSKCETNNMHLCFRYLSFDSIIVSCCQQDFLQLFSNHLLIETLLESHSYTLVQETLERNTCNFYYCPIYCMHCTQYCFPIYVQSFVK